MRQFGDTKVVFVHIPKTAGQAVVAAFGMKHRSTDHRIKAAEERHFLGPEFIRFCVVRDPLDRFVSAYRYSVHMLDKKATITERQLIREHDLQHDVNDFVDKIRETGFDIRSRLHFRPQLFFLRRTRPQILLRFENLENDITVIRHLAPDMWVGLRPVNRSEGRPASEAMNTQLNDANRAYLAELYKHDIRLLGYPSR